MLGANETGQLGDGSVTFRREPTQEVVGLDGATQLALGFGFTCALRGRGQVSCWGDNHYGQLGDGTRVDRRIPGPVLGLAEVDEIAADQGLTAMTCARSGGRIWCWGWADLESGVAAPVASPRQVPEIADATQMALGGGRICAIRSGGSVWCWGRSWAAPEQSPERVAQPQRIDELPAVAQLGMADEYACVRTVAGEVLCWGTARLLTHALPYIAVPRRVTGINNATDLAVGAGHACARLGGGAVVCWGVNPTGQLGDGEYDDRATRPPYAARPDHGAPCVAAFRVPHGRVCESRTGRLAAAIAWP